MADRNQQDDRSNAKSQPKSARPDQDKGATAMDQSLDTNEPPFAGEAVQQRPGEVPSDGVGGEA